MSQTVAAATRAAEVSARFRNYAGELRKSEMCFMSVNEPAIVEFPPGQGLKSGDKPFCSRCSIPDGGEYG